MFGHAAGAFTGATQRKDGLLIAADRGTLFLDEIGVMELGVQSKLLRALQERKVRRVGETDDVTVDVRVIAATNESLEARKDAGLFREDLFYRISVIPIQLPPLRQRLTDIPLLVRAFCHEQSQTLGLDVTLEQSVWDKLATYSWPGNVRELANAIACAAALCDKGLIRVRDLPPRIARVGDPEFRSLDTLPLAGPPRALRDYLRAKEKEYLEQILRHTDGNRAKAAELLGISRATFYRKLEGEGDPATGAE
jgi:DNA-binding NtrC family response regulator